MKVIEAEWEPAGVWYVSHKVVVWVEETPHGPVLMSRPESGTYHAAAINYANWEDYWASQEGTT